MKHKQVRTIAFLILSPLAFVILLIVCVGVYAFVSFSGDVRDLQNASLYSQAKSISQSLRLVHRSSERMVEILNNNNTDFYSKVESGDSGDIGGYAGWTNSLAGAYGYIFTNMMGDVVCTSYPSAEMFDGQRIQAVVARAKSASGTISATEKLLPDHLVDVVAAVVRNNDSDPIGVIIYISYVTADASAMALVKESLGDNTFFFIGDQCVYTSSETLDAATIKLDQAIGAKCYGEKTYFTGSSSLLGTDEYFCGLPLRNVDDEVVGVCLIKGDSHIVSVIISRLGVVVPVILGVFILIYIITCIRMRNNVLRPIRQILDGLKRIGTGDLTRGISTGEKCYEIELIAQGISESQKQIVGVLMPIHETAAALINSADQLSNASESLSNAANRQAASLEEISSSMEQMGANIQQNTDNAVHTNKLTEEMAAMAQKLSNASKNSFEAIKNIANDINDINDLVSQTNILALNASVEAARAGEQGQGFGVVAKEVGRLAEQTHDTADNINETATSSITEVEESFNQTQKIIPHIEKVASLIKEITTASVEQNSGVNQVNTAIMDLNRVTQENAAGAEEIAASTIQMRDMVNDLNKALSRFSI